MSRAERIAWGLTIALAVYVVPLRIAELAAHRAAYLAEMRAQAASQPKDQKQTEQHKESTDETE